MPNGSSIAGSDLVLTAPMQRFVRHWGEMGTTWGVNRTVAQIHALIYVIGRPLPADEITELLGVARSNVSNSLRELQSYGLVERVHISGERRDHFKALEDPWDMMLCIVEQRKRREIDPALQMVRECLDAAEGDMETPGEVRERMRRMHDLLQDLDGLYGSMRRFPNSVLRRLLRIGDRLGSILTG